MSKQIEEMTNEELYAEMSTPQKNQLMIDAISALKITVMVRVQLGLVIQAWADFPHLEVLIVDEDTQTAGGDAVVTIDGMPCFVYVEDAIYDGREIGRVQRQANE